MFIGHLAVGLAGKRIAPRVPLPALILAPILLDGLWPIFLLLGWERVRIDRGNTPVSPFDFQHYPWSHSLLMTLIWSALVALGYRTLTRDGRGALWLGAAVTSHWVLDWVTHRPDLPLWPGGPLVGLGLWRSLAGTVVIEVGMFLVGLWFYLRVTRPRGWMGRLSLWSLVVTLLYLYVGNLQPLPGGATEHAIALFGLLGWLFIPWAWWIERTRRTVRA
jgi:membrane-bound metal-dependent hydrolase YbcI (DUF457 family)